MRTNPSATPNETQATQRPATSRTNPESLIRESLDDIALVIGGAAALHHIDDDMVWSVMKRMDRIRVRLLRDLKGLGPTDGFQRTPRTPPRLHAAVEEFLARNRAGMEE